MTCFTPCNNAQHHQLKIYSMATNLDKLFNDSVVSQIVTGSSIPLPNEENDFWH